MIGTDAEAFREEALEAAETMRAVTAVEVVVLATDLEVEADVHKNQSLLASHLLAQLGMNGQRMMIGIMCLKTLNAHIQIVRQGRSLE